METLLKFQDKLRVRQSDGRLWGLCDLVLDAEQLVVGHSSRMEMIKDRMELKLRPRCVKVNIDLEEKMLQIEQQKAEIEHQVTN